LRKDLFVRPAPHRVEPAAHGVEPEQGRKGGVTAVAGEAVQLSLI
jgi:hypothetical protein